MTTSYEEPNGLPTTIEKPSSVMITRLELCEHWRLWDDCYDCSGLPEDELLRDQGEILIYLVSGIAPGKVVTQWGNHVGKP